MCRKCACVRRNSLQKDVVSVASVDAAAPAATAAAASDHDGDDDGEATRLFYYYYSLGQQRRLSPTTMATCVSPARTRVTS